MIRRSQSAVLPTETKPVLDQQLSLPDKKSSVGGISAGEDDQFEDHPGMGFFKNSQAQGTFTTLGNPAASFSPLATAAAFLEFFKSSRLHNR